MNKIKKYSIFTVILALFVIGGWAVFQSRDAIVPTQLPPAIPYDAKPMSPQVQDPVPVSQKEISPEEVNLNIPFVLQAPEQNWDLPYKQFCEEASALMVDSYIHNKPISDFNDADKKLLAIMDFEIKRFGFYEDTDIDQTAAILREYFGLEKVEIIPDPTSANIRSVLAEGRAVIAPLAGRQLNNPYFQQPGPLYHMIVIKGYKKNGDFITNDPGTKRGANFIYKEDVIMNAIHDWNGGNVDMGKKVILVVG